jgi:site-specific recombinase
MKNPAPQIRKKIFFLLDGNVSYNGDDIPVFEGEGISVPNMVIIGDYSQSGIPNKHSFMANAVQTIEIVTVKFDPSSKNSDEVTELVFNLLHPDPDSNLLNTDDFNVYVQAMPDMSAIREDSISGQKVVRRRLAYQLLIDHK